MYFLVILAFALLLTDDLPPARLNLLPYDPVDPLSAATALQSAAMIAFGLVAIAALAGLVVNHSALRVRRGTPFDIERTQERYTRGQVALLGLLAVSLLFLFICTPWMPLVRGLHAPWSWPLVSDVIIIAPFILSIVAIWFVLYPADTVIRAAAVRQRALEGVAPRPIWPVAEYLVYKLRHQILIIAGPMALVLAAKHVLDVYRGPIVTATRVPWAADALLGIASGTVLLIAPAFVRHIWSTHVLPPGELRDRLERQCRRMGLRYREILVWNSHGLVVNAAVMGFVKPLRYVLLSDGLIETMAPRQIEAVFGHEAGHVRHHHLQFFVLFAIVSMLAVGGLLEILVRAVRLDVGMLQLIAMAATIVVWGFGFGWVSRRFERQADVFGVRAITPDMDSCTPSCPVHAAGPVDSVDLKRSPLCLGAAHLFGQTLGEIADLNGIPRDAPSWRHGSINSRCRLLHRLAENPAAVRGFDRRVWRVKVGLIVLCVIGSAVATWLYWPSELFGSRHGPRLRASRTVSLIPPARS
ncbi:MAG: M48 family metallopeptidase [Phycisphaerae bacterium]|nr:M48 family metallopeptidase [Phycisphaerae bacterium]